MQFVVERIDIGCAKEGFTAHTAMRFKAAILHPLLKGDTVHAQTARGLARVYKGEAPTPRSVHHHRYLLRELVVEDRCCNCKDIGSISLSLTQIYLCNYIADREHLIPKG